MKNLVQALAQKSEATRLGVVRGCDIVLFLGVTLMIMSLMTVSLSPFAVIAFVVTILMIIGMANHIEGMAVKLRQFLGVGPQTRRPLTLIVTRSNLAALLSCIAIDLGILPVELASFSIIGVPITAALAIFLHLAVETDDLPVGGVDLSLSSDTNFTILPLAILAGGHFLNYISVNHAIIKTNYAKNQVYYHYAFS